MDEETKQRARECAVGALAEGGQRWTGLGAIVMRLREDVPSFPLPEVRELIDQLIQEKTVEAHPVGHLRLRSEWLKALAATEPLYEELLASLRALVHALPSPEDPACRATVREPLQKAIGVLARCP